MLPETERGGGQAYWGCCGKIICSGCCYAHNVQCRWEATCPFCRSPIPKKMEDGSPLGNGNKNLERLNNHIKANDANAYFELGTTYLYGDE